MKLSLTEMVNGLLKTFTDKFWWNLSKVFLRHKQKPLEGGVAAMSFFSMVALRLVRLADNLQITSTVQNQLFLKDLSTLR